jgi:transcriptional regulator with XRE-family HTH domain
MGEEARPPRGTQGTAKRSWTPPGSRPIIPPPPAGQQDREITIDTSEPSEPNDLKSAVGASLRGARIRAGLSLQQLAARSSGRFRPSSIGGYERGERAISIDRFVDLAQLVGVSADQLLADALARRDPHVHREVLLDLTQLPDTEAGRQTAEHVRLVRSRRGDPASEVVTLRAGDLQVIADASGVEVPDLLSSLGDAIRRVGPS